MKAIALVLALIVAGCTATPDPGPGLPGDLMREDDGTVSGSWRQVRSSGRVVFSGYQLTIDRRIGTFAVQKGCAATGGTLEPLGNDRYRIGHYTGIAAEGCPPWRATPELAPFHSSEVRLRRSGDRLFAQAGGSSAEFIRLKLPSKR